MLPLTLPDLTWQSIYAFLQTCDGIYVGNESEARRFIEAILWMARSGAQWRLLPKEYGHWNCVYKRFARWDTLGIWGQMHQQFLTEPDLEWLVLDNTFIRAHPAAAGALKKNGGQAAQALGRSRGGLSTKIHMIVDALGNPLDFVLTGGERHDVTQAPTLLAGRHSDYVIADKGYDSSTVLEAIEQISALPVVPARKSWNQPRYYDTHLYQERHVAECCVNKRLWCTNRLFAGADPYFCRVFDTLWGERVIFALISFRK